MTQEELDKLDSILFAPNEAFKARTRLIEWRKTLKAEEAPGTPAESTTAPQKGKRTGKQNDAMHVFFDHVAKALNDAGLGVQEVLAEATELDWTPYRVKELLWKKSLKKLYGKDSTTQMTKQGEIDNVYEHINRFLAKGFVKNETGERVYLESIPFPSEDGKNNIMLTAMENLKDDSYPEFNGPPTL